MLRKQLTNKQRLLIMILDYKKYKGVINMIDQEALDYFYEELESYYDEDEQGEIFDGVDD